MKIIREVFFSLIVMLGLVSAGMALAEETYNISVTTTVGTKTCTLSQDKASPGDTITVTLTPAKDSLGAYAVEFLKKGSPMDTIEIPGHPITRSYDHPDQFTFIMPAQDVWLKATCTKTVTIQAAPYLTIKEGTATPASLDNSVSAIPCTYTDKPLACNSTIKNGMFMAMDENWNYLPLDYLYRFEGGEDYGTVGFENNQLKYTPNAKAAGIKVTICLKAVCQGSISTELQFPVQVAAVPDPAKDRDATLSQLNYAVGDGQPVAIPLQPDTYAYKVELPYGTPLDKAIALSGVSTSGKGTITDSSQGNTDYLGSTATLTVQAEDESVTQQYTVHFIVLPPDVAPSVEIDGKAYEDGDKVSLTAGRSYELTLNHGSGAGGFKRGAVASQGDLPFIQGSWQGYYPVTTYNQSFTPKQAGTGKITVQYYDEGDALPARTIVLTVEVQPAPYVPSPPSIITQALPGGTVGAAYDLTLSAGGDPCAWSATGLPQGLSLEGGRISGTPTQTGIFEVTLIASNGGGSDQRRFSLVVYPADARWALTLNAQYLLLTVGGSARLTPQQAEYAALPVVWTVEGDAVTVEEGLVAAVKPGLAYVRCAVDVGGGQRRTAVCRVDVTEGLSDVSGAVLERRKLTVPIYKEQGAKLEIALTVPGNRAKGAPTVGAVSMAAFTQPKAAAEYSIEPIDDRTYYVCAKEGAQRRVSAVAITLADGRVIMTPKLTLAPSKKLPEVKGILVLEEGKGKLSLTGAQVKGVKLTDKPDWLEFDESTLEARLTGIYRKNEKLKVEVELEGWTRPLTVKASITQAKKADTPVLSAKSVTLFANDVYSTAQVTIDSGIAVERVTCDSKRFAVTDLGGGLLQVAFKDAKAAGKGATLKIKVYRQGEDKPVTLKLKVKIAR